MAKYDARHGGPYDRGQADFYYNRGCNPHYYKGGTYTSERVTDLTGEEYAAYMAGYENAMTAYLAGTGAQKDWD